MGGPRSSWFSLDGHDVCTIRDDEDPRYSIYILQITIRDSVHPDTRLRFPEITKQQTHPHSSLTHPHASLTHPHASLTHAYHRKPAHTIANPRKPTTNHRKPIHTIATPPETTQPPLLPTPSPPDLAHKAPTQPASSRRRVRRPGLS